MTPRAASTSSVRHPDGRARWPSPRPAAACSSRSRAVSRSSTGMPARGATGSTSNRRERATASTMVGATRPGGSGSARCSRPRRPVAPRACSTGSSPTGRRSTVQDRASASPTGSPSRLTAGRCTSPIHPARRSGRTTTTSDDGDSHRRAGLPRLRDRCPAGRTGRASTRTAATGSRASSARPCCGSRRQARSIGGSRCPSTKPTMPAFGGADLVDAVHHDDRRRRVPRVDPSEPEAGGLFAIETGIRGLPEPVFAGGPARGRRDATTLPPVWFERPVLPAFAPAVAARMHGPRPGHRRRPLRRRRDRPSAAVAGAAPYDAAFLDRAPRLRVIARTGIGYDGVDVAAATARGIAVCNTPDGPTVSTAEHAVDADARSSPSSVKPAAGRAARRGRRPATSAATRASSSTARSSGLVGFGRIARRVARIADGLGHARRGVRSVPRRRRPSHRRIRRADTLEALLRDADVVSVHVPLTDGVPGHVRRGRSSRR